METTIAIDKLDEDLFKRLGQEAQRRGTDVSTIVLEALRQRYPKPIRADEFGPVYRDLSDLAGTWSDEEVREFEANTAQFREIDEELWK